MILRNALKNWKTDWGNLLIILIPFAMAFPPISKFIISSLWRSIVIFVLFLVGWFQTNYYKDNISKLRNKLYSVENERDTLLQNMEAMPEEIIKQIYHHLKLGYNERITIYRHTSDRFIPVARYSINLEFRKYGRKEYPKNKGFIGKAWTSGCYYIDNLPNYENEPTEYLDQVSKISSMNKRVLRELTMKSRCYFCRNLVNLEKMPIAVIVIESKNPSLPVDKNEINAILDGPIGHLLIHTIEKNLPLGRG